MDIRGHRRSTNFEDRGRGGAGGRGGGGGAHLLSAIVRRLGIKGALVVGAIVTAAYFFGPPSVRQLIAGAVGTGSDSGGSGAGSACEASPTNAAACDFSRVVLASTEDTWNAAFASGALPRYGSEPDAYREPTLVVFADAVSTGGCGDATSDIGPFYCPADKKLYIDPTFYQVMEQSLRAPGDFAQAYVIAHEVGHHVQNLFGANERRVTGESRNQTSVRLELQADCLAGVWGHSARASLQITDEDLREAVNAAHRIGDDALGHTDREQFTHGSSEQRMRWFRRGFEGGDARRCDTFAVPQGEL